MQQKRESPAAPSGVRTVIVVCGPRDWPNREQVRAELDCYLESHHQSNIAVKAAEWRKAFVLRHGDSGNVDQWAKEWGLERGVTVEAFEAQWRDSDGNYTPWGGPVRNREMARAEPIPDLWLTFWDGKFRKRGDRKVSGTFDSFVGAVQAGIYVHIVPLKKR